jgi:hypothetical protein
MKRFAYLLLLLSPFFAFAQKRIELVHENAFSFYDYQEKAFCVLDDSTFLWKFDAKKDKWEKSPIDLKIEVPFAKFLKDFMPMSDKGTPVYFVFGGCGVVYAKKGNVIQRHDHSFYHMNQFGGSFFMDQGEPRIYGGYGLFTSKNIITRYDTINREWFMVYSSLNRPPAGEGNIILKHQGNYYVFDGFCGNGSQIYPLENLWRFNLKSKMWSKLGLLNRENLGEQEGSKFSQFQVQNKGYFCHSNMVLNFDLENMRYRKYKYYSTGVYLKIIKEGNLFLLLKATSKPSKIVEIADSSFLRQFDIEEGDLLLNEKSDYVFVGVVSLLILSILFILFMFSRKVIFKSKRSLEDKNLNTVETFNEFNQTEIELIQLLLFYQETGLEISQINDLVNYDKPSIDTLKKRREILLKDLRYKLAAKFNIPREDVFIERRMETDKRMKLLFLNDSIRLKL